MSSIEARLRAAIKAVAAEKGVAPAPGVRFIYWRKDHERWIFEPIELVLEGYGCSALLQVLAALANSDSGEADTPIFKSQHTR